MAPKKPSKVVKLRLPKGLDASPDEEPQDHSSKTIPPNDGAKSRLQKPIGGLKIKLKTSSNAQYDQHGLQATHKSSEAGPTGTPKSSKQESKKESKKGPKELKKETKPKGTKKRKSEELNDELPLSQQSVHPQTQESHSTTIKLPAVKKIKTSDPTSNPPLPKQSLTVDTSLGAQISGQPTRLSARAKQPSKKVQLQLKESAVPEPSERDESPSIQRIKLKVSAGKPKPLNPKSKPNKSLVTPITPKLVTNRRNLLPKRQFGRNYDSEAEDMEEFPSLENGLIFRMPPSEDCDYLRDNLTKLGWGVKQGGPDVWFKTFDYEGRRMMISIQGHKYAASIVDLPCIVEGLKSWDHMSWWKSINISQMLLVRHRIQDEKEIENLMPPDNVSATTWEWPHGIAPPLHDVRRKRFKKHGIDHRAIEMVETEVDRLMELEDQAEDTQLTMVDIHEPYASTPHEEMATSSRGEGEAVEDDTMQPTGWDQSQPAGEMTEQQQALLEDSDDSDGDDLMESLRRQMIDQQGQTLQGTMEADGEVLVNGERVPRSMVDNEIESAADTPKVQLDASDSPPSIADSSDNDDDEEDDDSDANAQAEAARHEEIRRNEAIAEQIANYDEAIKAAEDQVGKMTEGKMLWKRAMEKLQALKDEKLRKIQSLSER